MLRWYPCQITLGADMNDLLNPELERRCQIADARLGVAEEIGWAAASFAGLAAWLHWQAWWGGLGVAIAVYILAIWRYSQESKASWDAYERATRTGKYAFD